MSEDIDPSQPVVEMALRTLPVSIAVLDADATIVWVNDSWEAFGRDGGADPASIGVGANYIEAARDSDDYGDRAVEALEALVAGDRAEFTMEYPCHGPDREQWFLMWARRFEHDGDRYVTVAHFDITERARMEREVAETATEMSHQRDHLALLNQIVRHDIRNDIQLVLSHAEILEQSVPEEAREHVERVLQQATHIVDLTEAIRDLSEVIVGDSEPTLTPVNLGAVLQAEADKVRSTYGTTGTTITVTGTDDIPFDVDVLANEMLSSVVGNILTNAVIHNDSSDPHIDIEVDANRAEGTVVVTVADDGPGIPESDWQSVFGRGEMGIDSPGTGLGLYLVDRLVTLYEGDVWITDSHLGGTAVHVELRLAD